MRKEIAEAYRGSWKFVFALPVIAALPVVAELVQHLVEYQLGMYESMAAAKAVANDPARMWTGYLKIAVLLAFVYWVVRYMAFRDPNRAARLEPKAVRRFALVFLIEALLAIAHLQSGPVFSALTTNRAALAVLGLLVVVLDVVIVLLMTPWKVYAALGREEVTLGVSVRMMYGNLWWSLGFTLVMMLPLMLLHYLLGLGAIGRPHAVVWPALTADTFVAAYLGVVLAAKDYVIAERALRRFTR